MVRFPHAKINLGLNVVGKREDGYHEISSVLFPIQIFDILEITESSKTNIHISGRQIPGDTRDNLIWKAWELLNRDYHIPPIQVHLHKVIPMGAGLGGGSSDGTFALKMMNELFQLSLNDQRLHYYSSILGSDCPFFLEYEAAYATGRGTDLQTIDVNLDDKWLVLTDMGIHSSTSESYRKIKLGRPAVPITDAIRKPVQDWRGTLSNDFESVLFDKHLELKQQRDQLYDLGAIYAAMSGSGSSIFGIFNEKPDSMLVEDAFVVQMKKPA